MNATKVNVCERCRAKETNTPRGMHSFRTHLQRKMEKIDLTSVG